MSAAKFKLTSGMGSTRPAPSVIRTAIAGSAGGLAGWAWVHGVGGGARLLALIERLRRRPVPLAMDGPGGPGGGAPATRLTLAVGLATAGRPAIARATLERLARQTRPPDAVLVAVPTPADIERPDSWPDSWPDSSPGSWHERMRILVGPRGLTRQRNAILEAAGDADLICFFDDDFVPHEEYLACVERTFAADPGLVGATGRVIADGITGAGYSAAEAERLLAARTGGTPGVAPVYSAYGCNMVFRCAALRGLRFDEALPAYGWLEDVDFSRRAARSGGLARIEDAIGVHLGVKGGRQSGRRFGYSQIANPLYLMGKGSFARSRAARLMARNVAMNLLRAALPEPHIDRRGRIAGNLRALVDLLRGRLHPTRITDLP